MMLKHTQFECVLNTCKFGFITHIFEYRSLGLQHNHMRVISAHHAANAPSTSTLMHSGASWDGTRSWERRLWSARAPGCSMLCLMRDVMCACRAPLYSPSSLVCVVILTRAFFLVFLHLPSHIVADNDTELSQAHFDELIFKFIRSHLSGIDAVQPELFDDLIRGHRFVPFVGVFPLIVQMEVPIQLCVFF